MAANSSRWEAERRAALGAARQSLRTRLAEMETFAAPPLEPSASLSPSALGAAAGTGVDELTDDIALSDVDDEAGDTPT